MHDCRALGTSSYLHPGFLFPVLNGVLLLHNPSKIITVNATLFPTSVANSLIAVGTDGLQERDRMVRAAIAIICELGECLTTPQTQRKKHTRAPAN